MTTPQRRWTWTLGSLSAVALGYAGWTNRRLFTVHDVTTGESSAYPEFRSHVYYSDPLQVLNAVEQSVRSLPCWRVVRVDTANNALDAEVQNKIGGGTDDVTVYLTPLGGGQTRAVIRAHSRVNLGDFGRNAAHIHDLQDAMDRRLTSDASF